MQVHAGPSACPQNPGLMKSRFLALLLLVAGAGPAPGALPLQPWLDTALPGASIRLPPGVYQGPAVISKPLTLEGNGQVIIDGGGKGTVLTVKADRVTLRGLTIRASGDSHDALDGGLMAEGRELLIEDNVIEDVLFGISLHRTNDSIVRGNRIRSRPVDPADRGDGLRLWYSKNNRVEGNSLINSRDFVVWYSDGNVIRNNLGRRSRYSMHFMFAHSNLVEGNRYYDNAVGIYVMYTDGVIIRNNIISHANGATGMGIGFKEASNTLVESNDIIYCATGIGSDLSPYEPDTKIWIRNNRIAFNGIGILFNNERIGNIVTDNVFEGNITQVAVNGGGSGRAHAEATPSATSRQ